MFEAEPASARVPVGGALFTLARSSSELSIKVPTFFRSLGRGSLPQG